MNDNVSSIEAGELIGAEYPHDSAHLHVAGEATYVDDIVEPQDTLYATVGKSSKPHARIVALDLVAVHAAPGVVAVLTAADIPGQNNAGPVIHDEPILAGDEVQYVGQPIFAVAACSVNAARRAALLAKVDYEDLPATLTIEDALARGSFVLPTERLRRGNASVAIAGAPHRLAGQFRCGGQDHQGRITGGVRLEGDRGGMAVGRPLRSRPHHEGGVEPGRRPRDLRRGQLPLRHRDHIAERAAARDAARDRHMW